jgi:uracil-DNA glycosylase
MVAAVRCAPPANKPEPAERNACAPWLAAELRLVTADLRVIVCLGGFAWPAIWPVLGRCGFALPRPRPRFGHGAEVRLTNQQAPGEVLLIGCYHPSQQNTFTGRVTPAMLDAIFPAPRPTSMPVPTRKPIVQLLIVNVDLVINYAPQFVCSKRG